MFDKLQLRSSIKFGASGGGAGISWVIWIRFSGQVRMKPGFARFIIEITQPWKSTIHIDVDPVFCFVGIKVLRVGEVKCLKWEIQPLGAPSTQDTEHLVKGMMPTMGPHCCDWECSYSTQAIGVCVQTRPV